MKRQILGLDINDDLLAAVVVEQKAGDNQIVACAFDRIDDRNAVSDHLPVLISQVGWQTGDCFCGISLSCCSLRNLSLPFIDRKKISQILAFELEDQMITPVSDQIVEYIITGTSESFSRLLIFGLEKECLSQVLDQLRQCNLNPDAVLPGTMVLAEQFLSCGEHPGDFLMLDAGLHAMDLVLSHEGRIVFARRLPYPDRIFTEHPFYFQDGRAGIAHHEEAMACIAGLCETVRRSIGFFRIDSGLSIEPGQLILTGCMGQVDAFRNKIQAELGLEVIVGHLRQESGIFLTDRAAENWQPGCFDHALALALGGLKKKQALNFRKDEFAKPKMFLASRPQRLAAAVVFILLVGGAAGLFFMHYRALEMRYTQLGREMKTIFQETFPGLTRIDAPLMQMQARLRKAREPAAAIPAFSGDKRVLNILADISARIPAPLSIHVSRLVIDQETVQVKGTTNTFNNVNLIQSRLRQSILYDDVKIVSATADKDKALIRFELRLQLGGSV